MKHFHLYTLSIGLSNDEGTPSAIISSTNKVWAGIFYKMSDSDEAEGLTDINLQVMLEQTSKALQDAPLQIIVDLLLEELLQREANAEAEQQIDNETC